MDSPLSESPDTIGPLRHAIWHHDWDDAAALAAGERQFPPDHDRLQRSLAELEEVLALARSSRLELFSALRRLQAIAGFTVSE